MTESESAINMKMGLIALGIVIVLFVVNMLINPPFIPDKTKPAISCDANGFCQYPEKSNPYYICGPIFIILVLLCFIFIGKSYFAKKAYIMTFREAYQKIPIEDSIAFKIPPVEEIDPSLIIPKDSGKSMLIRYRDTDGYSYIKLSLMSDFKNSSTDFSRKSPILGWTHMPISSYTASMLMKSDADMFKKLGEMDRVAEKLIDKPLTSQMFKERIESERKRMNEPGGDE